MTPRDHASLTPADRQPDHLRLPTAMKPSQPAAVGAPVHDEIFPQSIHAWRCCRFGNCAAMINSQ